MDNITTPLIANTIYNKIHSTCFTDANKDAVSDCLHSKATLNVLSELQNSISDKVKGCIAGNIIGDMLGLPIKGKIISSKRSSFTLPADPLQILNEHIAKYGCNSYGETVSLLIALYNSLLEKKKVDKENELSHYRKWLIEGKYTQNGKATYISKTVKEAVLSGKPGTTREDNDSGALKRSSVLICFYLNLSSKTLEDAAGESASVTHAHPVAIFSSIIYLKLLKELILGKTMEDAMTDAYNQYYNIIPDINDIFFEPIHYQTADYVVSALQSAVWLNIESESFEEAISKALSIGGDTDIICAVTGAIAGAIYGYNRIPQLCKNLLLSALPQFNDWF
jgi:ADP-ribosyl-[dinitrogen reductase] hydrolase